MVRLFLRVLLCGSLFFLVALAAAVLLLRTDLVQQKIKGLAVEAVEKQLHAKLKVGRVGGNLLYNLSLEDVAVEGDDGLLFKARRISANYLGPMLLEKVVFIQTLRIEGLLLNLKEGPDGRFNLEKLMPPEDKAGPSSFVFVLKRIALSDSEAVLTTMDNGEKEVRRLYGVNAVADLGKGSASSGKGIALEFLKGAFRMDRPKVALNSLTGRAVYYPADKSVLLSDLRVKTEASDLTLNGGFGLDWKAIDLKARLQELSLEETARVLSIEAPLRGAVKGGFELEGTPEHLFHRLELRFGTMSLATRGYLNLTGTGGPGADLSSVVRNLSPADLPIQGTALPAGDVNLDVSLKARSLSSPSRSIAARFLFKPSRLSGREIESGDIAVRVDGDRLTLEEGRLKGPLGRVDVKGTLSSIRTSKGPLTLKLNAAVRDFDLKAFALETVAGKANFDLSAEATAPALSARALEPQEVAGQILADFKPSVLNGVKVRGGRLEAAWTDGRLDLKRAELFSEPADIALSGAVAPRKKRARLAAKITLLDLSALPSLLAPWLPLGPDNGLSGKLKISGDIDGWWNRPEATGKVEGRNVSFRGVSSSRFTLSGRWRGPVQAFDSRFDVDLKDLDVKGNRFSEAGAKLRLLPAIATVELAVKRAGGEEGRLKGVLKNWAGPVKEARVDRLQLISGKGSAIGRVADRIVNEGPIRIKVSPDLIDIASLKLASGKARFSLEGRVARDGQQDLRLAAEDMPLERFSPLLPGVGNLKGSFFADAALSGTAEKPLVEGRLELREASGFGISFSRLDAGLRYDGSTAYLKADLYRRQEHVLNIDGRAGLTFTILPFSLSPRPNSLAVRLTAEELNVAELPLPRTPGMDLSGKIRVSATAEGDVAAPVLKGNLSMQEGSLSLKDSPFSYKILEGNLSFTQTAVEINTLLVEDREGGKVKLAGRIGLKGVKPADLDVSATGKDFHVPYKRIARARIDPHLTLTGALSAPRLQGTVRIEEAKVDLERLKEQGPAEIQVIRGEAEKGNLITIPEKEAGSSAFMAPLSADVAVDIPKDAWLKGEGANVELQGQINLKKDPGKPFILLGSLNTVRGTYEFQGKVFKVTEGTVQFRGLEEPDPKLDIQAQTKIGQVAIIVALAGSARNLKLSLSSDPQMDQTDIVSYLVFGKPARSLDSQQALNAEGAALSLGGQIAASQLKKILGDVLSLDMITINPGGEKPGEGSISVGKYVTDDVFVTYNQGFSTEHSPSLGVAYEINRNFSVETQLGDEKTSGVDLIFQFDFGD